MSPAVTSQRLRDCTICYDKGVIHFTDLAPSSKHRPTPGIRPLRKAVGS